MNIPSSDIAELISWKPAYKNEFYAIIDDIPNTQFLVSSVSFAGSKLTLTRHNVSKLFTLDKFNRADDVTITWREDSGYSVRSLHQDWFKKFYNEKEDYYISHEGTPNVYKSMSVHLGNGLVLRLNNLLPTSIPDLQLSWSSPSITEYSLTYKVTTWEWKEPLPWKESKQ